MSNTQELKSIRLWPGLVILILQWFARFALPEISPDAAMFGMMGAIFICSPLMLLWWLFFSRIPWSERLGGLAMILIAFMVSRMLLHESIKTGSFGLMYLVFLAPVMSLALVVWGFISRSQTGRARWNSMAALIVGACAMWLFLRTEGATGEFDQDFAWRWSQTHEQRLLAESGTGPTTVPITEEASSGAEWPGFLGVNRDNVVSGTRIETDWATTPPQEMWRRPIGPGWSSFSVRGDLLFTQEQRGEDEVVACYRVSTGEPVWWHKDKDRFWESIGGAGPRGTPTLDGNEVYTLGGNGRVNALNLSDGSVIWSRNAVEDTGAEIPGWGISGSPLVLKDQVLVAASSCLISYDRASGEPRWTNKTDGVSYSSPQQMTFAGIPQILLLTAQGLKAVNPSDGKQYWQHGWEGEPIIQPTLTANGDLLIHAHPMSGMRRITVSGGEGSWQVKEHWTSTRLKPYYSEFLVHQGHAFGFDGSILACINLENGERKWKGGRYGAGQMFLLADQGLLVVLAEDGRLALVRAGSDKFEELSSIQALDGKTWNHPVLVGDVLLVRNAQEMAAYRLSLIKNTAALGAASMN